MKFRHTNFMRLIYATLLALPFVAILSRVIYVQSNKNAYQSAEITQTTYDRVETQAPTNEVSNYSDCIQGNYYNVEISNNLIDEGMIRLIITNTSQIYFNTYPTDSSIDEQSFDIQTYMYFENKTMIELWRTEIFIFHYFSSGNIEYYISEYFENNSISIKGDFIFEQFSQDISYDGTLNEVFSPSDYVITTYNEIQATTLDNVFEYSVNKFIENNNFGKINLFQWTTNLFFDSNDVNNMYVGFINWYLNYTLLLSATYILFLVLMWFINYARRLLERGMNYDW